MRQLRASFRMCPFYMGIKHCKDNKYNQEYA
nr:MAG TPA: hypothetical protein [Caudoviricetes sp.]